MKRMLKLSTFLTLAIAWLGLVFAQVSPVAAASGFPITGPAHTASPSFPIIDAPLPVEILAVVVCVIFVAIAVFPLFSEKHPSRH
jgi:hypothetical protein